MILGLPPQVTGMQAPTGAGPGSPAYVGQQPPQPQQQAAMGAPAASSPLVQALIGQQAAAPQPSQQTGSPLGGMNLGMLAQMFGQQQRQQPQVPPQYTGATGPWGNNTPGGLPVGGGAAQYP